MFLLFRYEQVRYSDWSLQPLTVIKVIMFRRVELAPRCAENKGEWYAAL